MIIWLNGAFGVGKTTISKELKSKIKGSVIFEPELVGNFLMDSARSLYSRDPLGWELWQVINYEILKRLSLKHKYIIVPMNIIERKDYDSILGRLIDDGIDVRHIILDADKETILNRLKTRGESGEWAYKYIDIFIEACNTVIPGEKVNSNKSISEIVLQIENLCSITLDETPKSTR